MQFLSIERPALLKTTTSTEYRKGEEAISGKDAYSIAIGKAAFG